jgi:circadian clock protein KaiC
MHLARMHRESAEIMPSVVDPISSLMQTGVQSDVHAMLLRLLDHLKAQQITTLFTNLTHGMVEMGVTDAAVSSLMDSWLLLLNCRRPDPQVDRRPDQICAGSVRSTSRGDTGSK